MQTGNFASLPGNNLTTIGSRRESRATFKTQPSSHQNSATKLKAPERMNEEKVKDIAPIGGQVETCELKYTSLEDFFKARDREEVK